MMQSDYGHKPIRTEQTGSDNHTADEIVRYVADNMYTPKMDSILPLLEKYISDNPTPPEPTFGERSYVAPANLCASVLVRVDSRK